MKRVFCLILALSMALILVACASPSSTVASAVAAESVEAGASGKAVESGNTAAKSPAAAASNGAASAAGKSAGAAAGKSTGAGGNSTAGNGSKRSVDEMAGFFVAEGATDVVKEPGKIIYTSSMSFSDLKAFLKGAAGKVSGKCENETETTEGFVSYDWRGTYDNGQPLLISVSANIPDEKTFIVAIVF